MSRTSMAVEMRKFSKILNFSHYLLKTRAKCKKNWQNGNDLEARKLSSVWVETERCWPALWPAAKNGSTTIILSAENNGECLDMPPRRQPDRIFTVLRLCSAFGGTSSVLCIMSCWNPVKPSQGVGIERNWCVRAEHWRRNGHSTKRDTTKLSSSMTMFSHMS